jgi:hypothetical protein
LNGSAGIASPPVRAAPVSRAMNDLRCPLTPHEEK